MGVLDGNLDVGAGDAAAPAEQPVQHTGFFENVAGGYRSAKAGPASTRSHQNAAEAKYYDQIVDALNARGYTTTDPIPMGQGQVSQSRPRPFVNPYTGKFGILHEGNPLARAFIQGDPQEMANLWASVAKERQRDPSFLKDLPDSNAVSERAVADRQKILQQGEDVYNRAGTMGTIGNFVGGIAAAPFEPESYVGGGAGGAGKTVARSILKEAIHGAAANAAAAVVAIPGQAADAEDLGTPMTVGDMAKSVGEQAGFGALFNVGVHAAPHVARRIVDTTVEHLPEPIRNAAVAASLRAGTVDTRATTAEARRALTPYTVTDRATPDEKAALHVADAAADVKEASPLHPEADAHHENRLAAVMQSLGIEEAPPPVATPAPVQHAAEAPDLTTAINHAEGTGKNPRSSASGVGQFIKSTWLDLYKRHFGGEGMSDAQILALRDNPEIGRQMTSLYRQENATALRRAGLEDTPGNLSLAHFLGPAGARDVLKAAPDTPVEQLLPANVIRANREVLAGKTAGEVIAWAHKRIGATTDLPVARADAVPEYDYNDDLIPEDLPPVEHRQFGPEELTTDARLMQYKSGGDEAGVTDRLQGVTDWNPLLSGKVIVWQDIAGRNVIVDGHQRLGLAKRLAADDPNIKLDAVVLREADGVTAQQARVMGALKNIAEGTGSLVDAARVLRDAPNGMDFLPPRAANVKGVRGLVGLNYDAFGAVLNDVIDPETAAAIGRIAPDRPETHMALVDLLAKSGVTTPAQAETVVRQALADGFGSVREEQMGLFGGEQQQSLYGPAARILDNAKRRLRQEKRSFKVLTEDAAKIEQAGNVLDRAANEARVLNSDQAIAIIDATAHSQGPVRDALLDAARRAVAGDSAGAVRQFLDALGGIDLHAAARGVSEGGPDGRLPLESRSALDAPEEAPQLALSDRPSPGDVARSAAVETKDFSEPAGEAAKAQTEHVEHDLLMDLPKLEDDARTFRLSEEGGELPAQQIIDEADADLNAVDAAERCLRARGRRMSLDRCIPDMLATRRDHAGAGRPDEAASSMSWRRTFPPDSGRRRRAPRPARKRLAGSAQRLSRRSGRPCCRWPRSNASCTTSGASTASEGMPQSRCSITTNGRLTRTWKPGAARSRVRRMRRWRISCTAFTATCWAVSATAPSCTT
jgi:hypothetical protein